MGLHMGANGADVATPVRSESGFWHLALPLVLYRGYFLLFVFLGIELLPPIFATHIYYDNFRWPADAEPSLVSAFKTWDGNHYLYLSEVGYQPDQISNAFYPLWPTLIRLGAPLAGGNHLVAALVLANLLSVAGLVLFHRFVSHRHGDSIADTALLLLLAYPGALFFAFAYSESLFLCLTMAFFLALHRRQYLSAALFAFLLPLARPVGALIAVPFFYDIYRAGKEEGRLRPADLAYLAAPAAGIAVYLVIMYLATGNPLAGMEAQDYFVGQRSLAGVFDLPGFFRRLVDIQSWHDYLHSPFDRLWFLLLMVSLVKIWRLDRRYFWFSVTMGVVPVLTGTFWSFTRFLVLVFPVFIALADTLSAARWKGLRWLTASLLFALQVLFLIRHVNNYWAG